MLHVDTTYLSSQGRNRNMPQCCAGPLCKYPHIRLEGGGIGKCPDCSRKIHDPCAIEDGNLDGDLSKMNVCPECFDVRNSKPPAKPAEPVINPYKRKQLPISIESESAAKENESAAKTPKTNVSTLVHLIREFIKTILPRINKFGQLYSIPSGASGRAAAKQEIINAKRHIKTHFPQYPYYYLPNPDIRASDIKVQGIWSTKTKLKAMQQFTVPEGLRFLVICP